MIVNLLAICCFVASYLILRRLPTKTKTVETVMIIDIIGIIANVVLIAARLIKV